MHYMVKDLMKRFGVGEHAILEWIKNGELKAINVGRSLGKKRPRWRISEAALAEFERNRSSAPQESNPPQRKRRTSRAAVVDLFP